MIWLQNIIIITISFLLSRILIDSNAHNLIINYLLKRSGNSISGLISGILFISFLLSVFFSNTVVALSLIPVIKHSAASIKNREQREAFVTYMVLALIYGANIGGMGSLIGSALNVLYVGFIEISEIAGREYINFFSWLIVGLPVSFVLALISRYILKIGEKKELAGITIPLAQTDNTDINLKKYIIFYLANLIFITLLSALQFLLKPDKIYSELNIIDLIFVIYLAFFLFSSFILQRTSVHLFNISVILYTLPCFYCLRLLSF